MSVIKGWVTKARINCRSPSGARLPVRVASSCSPSGTDWRKDGEAYINQRRAEALDDTIVKYRPVIERISALLREDFDFVAKRRKFIATKALHPLGESYNAAVDRGDDAKRRKLLGTIKTAVTAYEKKVVEIGEIQQALDGFDRAHDALVAYARSDKGPDDLGVLVGEIERYAAVARMLFEAVTAATASEPG